MQRFYRLSVFSHVSSSHAKESVNKRKVLNWFGSPTWQKEVFTWEKSWTPTALAWYANMSAVSLFCNMAAMTSLCIRSMPWSIVVCFFIVKIRYYFKPSDKRNEKSSHSHIFFFLTKYFWPIAFLLHLCKHWNWIMTSNKLKFLRKISDIYIQHRSHTKDALEERIVLAPRWPWNLTILVRKEFCIEYFPTY